MDCLFEMQIGRSILGASMQSTWHRSAKRLTQCTSRTKQTRKERRCVETRKARALESDRSERKRTEAREEETTKQKWQQYSGPKAHTMKDKDSSINQLEKKNGIKSDIDRDIYG